MKKSPIFKLLVLILALSMTVSLFACDTEVPGETKPEETTGQKANEIQYYLDTFNVSPNVFSSE